MGDFPKNKLSPHRQALYEAADAQRKLCRDWLLYIMSASSERTRTKDDLRADPLNGSKSQKAHSMWPGHGPSKRAAIDTGMNRYHDLERSRGARYSLDRLRQGREVMPALWSEAVPSPFQSIGLSRYDVFS